MTKSGGMRRARPCFAWGVAWFFAAMIAPAAADAQVRWDAGLAGGVMQRFATGSEPAQPSVGAPTPGPVVQASAHVALVPMIRIGAYAAYDIAPIEGRPARQIAEGGFRAKVTPPLLSSPWRSWAFVGLGYARTYEPGFTASLPGSMPPVQSHVASAVGGILDLPVGVGIGYRIRHPWELFSELGARIGLGFFGATLTGQDSFALSLTVGVSWDE
jgi:hypothetical protein